MSLEFDGTRYRTITDVKAHFRVAEKTIRTWIRNGRVPEPQHVAIGARRFRHFTDEWMELFRAELEAKRVPR